MSPNDNLLKAIFGPAPGEEPNAHVRDLEEEVNTAKGAVSAANLSWPEYRWKAGTFYGSPCAVGIALCGDYVAVSKKFGLAVTLNTRLDSFDKDNIVIFD